MRSAHTLLVIVIASALLIPASLLSSGCESLPGSRTEQSTVIGGAGGAAIGAILAKENRLLGALIGGAIGAGGGYLIGAETDWFEGDRENVEQEAREAARNAQSSPATAEQAQEASTADINDDGFVTLDEVIAMDRADFSDGKMLDRLRATGQVFDLNDAQEEYLRENGVSENVIRELVSINRAERDRLIDERGSQVISSEPE